MTQQRWTTARALGTAGRVARWSALLGLVALLVAVVAVPRVSGAETFTVLSGSMRPVLDPGDLVVVRPAEGEEVGIGSIVTFQLESGDPAVTTHRVVSQGVDRTGGSVFLTRGDGNEAADPVWIKEAQLRGTVWYAVPYAGYVAQLLPQDFRPWATMLVAAGLFSYALAMVTQATRERRGARHA
ncbi:MAG: hypothetical protein AVDCRST_MAG47-226 [uncultured Nocardioidaceae bacterium]|uniref:Signal peptidase I n=1 Tax=uncultured Nocardioidaceae bacterium TaxID=253824 RepID=A0A6J4MKQ2_9ACTN|nr:MAG: hypothetical protein AVDCRST_MAG47-226 [uncultured Nocardioidaceae bacterium]